MNKAVQSKKSSMRWGVERRMEFIEFRLFWEGGINRSDIVEQFGVSAPQASNDLSSYKEIASSNIEYDLSEKRYLASTKFKPLFLKPDTDRYLSQLKLIGENLVTMQETWISLVPSVDVIPVPHRHVDLKVLKPLTAAVRNGKSIEAYYQSMNQKRPDPVWRQITPHAFFNDGMRWHVRAFCHLEDKFKDFLLSRFIEIKGEGESARLPADDKHWHQHFDVVLIPNPKLSKGQQDIIALDYGMHDRRLVVPVRNATLYYFKKRLRLDVAEAFSDPRELPVIIENQKAFEAALAAETAE
jgi:hypothetical protein